MTDQPAVLVCITTVSSPQEARQIAEALLGRGAAACVQIDGPIESHYRWNEEDRCEQEYRLMIKTSRRKQDTLRELLKALHPYDEPQIITLQSVDVHPGYAAWVEGQTP